MKKALVISTVIFSIISITTNIFVTKHIQKSVSEDVQAMFAQLEPSIERKLINKIKNLKPESYQEALIQSNRLLMHVKFLSEKFYNGDILAKELSIYADNAYEAMMENAINNQFYATLSNANISAPPIKYFYFDNESGSRIFSDDIQPDGVLVRNKYFMNIPKGSVFASVVEQIPTSYLNMVNDVVVYPECGENKEPIIVYGELYTENSEPYGVTLTNENVGWRIGFEGIHPMSTEALENRVIVTTACRNEDTK